MIKAIITDLSRVLLFPIDDSYSGSLNNLYKKEFGKPDFRFFDYFRLNNELLDQYRFWHTDRCRVYILTSDVIQTNPELQVFWKSAIDKIFSASEMHTSKNKQDAYTKLLDEINLLPEEVVYIDDNPENLKVAEKVGLHIVEYKNNNDAIFEISKILEEKDK